VLVNGAGAGAVDAPRLANPGQAPAAPLLPRLAEGIETAMHRYAPSERSRRRAWCRSRSRTATSYRAGFFSHDHVERSLKL